MKIKVSDLRRLIREVRSPHRAVTIESVSDDIRRLAEQEGVSAWRIAQDIAEDLRDEDVAPHAGASRLGPPRFNR